MSEMQRIEDLEIKCAHLELGLQELSDVLYRQQQQLDRLLAANEALLRQVERLAEQPADGSSATAEEVPPHY